MTNCKAIYYTKLMQLQFFHTFSKKVMGTLQNCYNLFKINATTKKMKTFITACKKKIDYLWTTERVRLSLFFFSTLKLEMRFSFPSSRITTYEFHLVFEWKSCIDGLGIFCNHFESFHKIKKLLSTWYGNENVSYLFIGFCFFCLFLIIYILLYLAVVSENFDFWRLVFSFWKKSNVLVLRPPKRNWKREGIKYA